MNHYGHMAQDYSRRHRPQAYAAIAEPTAHFTDLGELVQAAVTDFRDELLGPTHPNESPLHYQQRSFQALRTAEEVILSDLVWLPPEPEPEEEPDPQLEAYYRGLQEWALSTIQATQTWADEDLEPQN